jgi:hypothetical protein
MHRKVTAALVAVIVPSAIGCGGGGGGGGSLSKADFTKRVDAVCSQALAPLQDAQRATPEQTFKLQVQFFAYQIDKLADIEPPDGLTGTFADFKASLRTRQALLRKLHAASAKAKGDSATVRSLERQQGRQFARASRLVHELGLSDCR